LKELLADKLKARCREIGMPEFFEMIADETVATSSEELLEFLQKAGHPALTMDPIL
jgi:acetyl-CoA synthase